MRVIRNLHFKKKRLRKKYHQGEFKELGFEFRAQWNKQFINDEYNDACIFVVDCIEKVKLECGGSFSNKGVSLFVCKNKGSCTRLDIENLLNLVNETGMLKNIEIGELQDVWY